LSEGKTTFSAINIKVESLGNSILNQAWTQSLKKKIYNSILFFSF
jgi:hypothetical protein